MSIRAFRWVLEVLTVNYQNWRWFWVPPKLEVCVRRKRDFRWIVHLTVGDQNPHNGVRSESEQSRVDTTPFNFVVGKILHNIYKSFEIWQAFKKFLFYVTMSIELISGEIMVFPKVRTIEFLTCWVWWLWPIAWTTLEAALFAIWA